MQMLLVASEVPPVRSGVSRSVGRIVGGLRARGYDIDLVSAADAPALRRDELRLSGLGLHLPSLLRRMRAAEVVNVHGPSPTIADLALTAWSLLPRSARPPLVYTHHFTVDLDDPRFDRACAVYDRFVRSLARRVSRLIVTSHDYAVLLDSRQGPPIDVIPWGVDADAFAGPRAAYDGTRPLRVLLLGQLRRYKGSLLAIDAVAGRPELELSIVGSGPLESVIAERIVPMDNVTLTTGVGDEDLRALFGRHDVILLPSTNRTEAFGIALLEGMAAGCVPVASDLDGVREVASATGIVTRTGDADHLRDALVALASDPGEVHRRSTASVAHAASLSWDRTVAAYDDSLRAATRRWS